MVHKFTLKTKNVIRKLLIWSMMIGASLITLMRNEEYQQYHRSLENSYPALIFSTELGRMQVGFPEFGNPIPLRLPQFSQWSRLVLKYQALEEALQIS